MRKLSVTEYLIQANQAQSVIATYSTMYGALTAILQATDGLAAHFMVVDTEYDRLGVVKETSENPNPERYIYSSSAVVSGFGGFEIGYMHSWRDINATGDQFIFTICTDPVD